ncbi:uncharacterized protein HaLaN_07114, partial [Haematococcus lacustris]
RVDLESGGSLRAGAEAEAQAAGKGSLPNLCSGAEACRPRAAALQAGGRGKFLLRGLKDVGTMQQLEVGHDGSGLMPGWHLAWVRVTNLGSGASALFPCNQWLSAGKGDKKTSRVLDAEE